MREAAVATIITVEYNPKVLVLKRTTNPSDPWSGQYAFPGGRKDVEDKTLLETCMRETYEECGIELPCNTLIKQYPVRHAGNYLNKPTPVTTYLFEISEQPAIQLQQKEISGHEWLELGYAADKSNIIKRPMSPRCPERLFPCLPAAQGVVWGFTFETLMMIIADRYSDDRNGSF